MQNQRIVLGLDIGIASIGYGLVRLTEEPYKYKLPDGTQAIKQKIISGDIIKTGVRTFQPPQDKDGKSLAKNRGDARRVRKTLRRKVKRMKRMIELAKEFELIPSNCSRSQALELLKPKKGDKEKKWDIWQIRKQALERKLTDIELFRVMYHIAKHRGFYFHTEAEELQKEDTKSQTGKEKDRVKKGLAKIRNQRIRGNWKTIGQMFCEQFNQKNQKDKRKRNVKDSYEHAIHRLLLKKEIKEIFRQQKEKNNRKTKDNLLERYINEILMHEQGIDEDRLIRMINKCEFTEQTCAPKESYTAERFMLFNRLNSLELIDKDKKDEHIILNGEQRKKIEDLTYKYTEVKYSQIRKELKLEDKLNLQFNLCSYSEKNPEFDKALKVKVTNKKPEFNDKHIIKVVDISTGEESMYDKQIQDIFNRLLIRYPNAKNLSVYYSDLRKKVQLNENQRFKDILGKYTQSEHDWGSKAKYLKQFEDKDVFIKLSGFHKIKNAIKTSSNDDIWENLKTNSAKLDILSDALTYCKSDDTRRQFLVEHKITDENIIKAVLTLNMKQIANFSREAMKNLLEYMERPEGFLLFNEAKKECGYSKKDYQKQPILKPYSGDFENNPVVARVISQTRKLINALIRKYSSQYPIDQINIEVGTDLASSEKVKYKIRQSQERYKENKKVAYEMCIAANLNPDKGQNLLMFRLAMEQNKRCPYTGKAITFYPSGAANEVYVLDCEIDHIIPMSRSFNDSLNNKVLCTQKANQEKKNKIPFEWLILDKGKSEESEDWRAFEVRIKSMMAMPFTKKKNLLRKSWTQKDMENFLSRNLNDTRYATRHIADYLRKYFDFSKSKRDDINPASRIQLRSGSITAFLRHMWGLNKNREENDLHHAVDAIVVACSTHGHVYLVSNLAKEIEIKGKNWYKHFSRDKFKPWPAIREDIVNSVNDIFVSRMPRHKVTGTAHKDTIGKLNGKIKNRVIKVNGGYADMGEMVRADVFCDKEGKYYVVPVYAVDIVSNQHLPNKYVPDDGKLTYDDWPSINDKGFSFKYSIFKDDLISINGNKYYVSFFEAATPNVNVKNIDGSIFESKKDSNDPYTKKIGYRPKRKGNKCVIKKYSVDMLGNYKEVEERQRPANKYGKK